MKLPWLLLLGILIGATPPAHAQRQPPMPHAYAPEDGSTVFKVVPEGDKATATMMRVAPEQLVWQKPLINAPVRVQRRLRRDP